MFGSIFSRLAGGGAAGAGEAAYDDVLEAARSGQALLVDVREAHEFAGGHIPGSVNRPLSSFDPAQLPADKPAILFCLSGARSASALAMCRRAGRASDRNYREGVPGWRARGGQMQR